MGAKIAENLDSWGQLGMLAPIVPTCTSSPLIPTSKGKRNQPTICISYGSLIVVNSDLLELHFKAQQHEEKSLAIFTNIYKFLRDILYQVQIA